MEDSRSHSSAVPLNFQPLRSNLSINLLNMHDSVPVLLVTRSTRKENISVLQLCVMQTFYSELYDSGLFDELKTITTVIQMYSNSLLSRSIQTPKSAVTNTSLLFTNASCFGNTQKKSGPGLFHHATVFFTDDST